MRLTITRLRAVRAVVRPVRTRYASTAIQSQEDVVPVSVPVVTKTPLVNELEGLYDILEGQVGGDSVWSERVVGAVRRLDDDSRIRVGVYSDTPEGVPGAAGNVVTALLLDPFSEDAATTAAIQRRHDEVHTGGEFIVRYDDATRREVNSLTVAAPWLRDAACDIIEPTTHNPEETLSSLLSTDTIILVIDPLRLLTPRLQELARAIAGKPLHIIIDGPIPGRSAPGGIQAARQTILTRLQSQWRTVSDLAMPEPYFLDSEAGITAIHALRSAIDPAASSASRAAPDFSAFQEPYLASNLGATSQHLLARLRSLQPNDQRTRTAEHIAAQARAYIRRVLADASKQVLAVRSQAEDLRARAAHEAALIGRTSGVREGNVRAELERARAEVEAVLQRFRVWGTGAERVGEEVAGVVGARWGHSLAHQLAFECGQLEQIHQRVAQDTEKVLKAHASNGATPAPFYSPLLMNQLSQLDRDVRITPSTLLAPIDARRAQLLISSVPAIQRRALRTTLTGWSTTFLSASASWTACVPLEILDAPTATALGLLGTTASLRWAVGAWAKTQRAFWRDWERVEQGLEEDLTRAVNEVVGGRVVKKAVVGAEGLEVLAKRRMEKVDEVEAALERVRRR